LTQSKLQYKIREIERRKMPRKKTVKKPKAERKITADEFIARVRMKAYEIYEKRGYSHGQDLDDWLEAERIVKEELGIKEK
jgi:hypothetical protein